MLADGLDILQFGSDVDPEARSPFRDESTDVDAVDLVTFVSTQQTNTVRHTLRHRFGAFPQHQHNYP
jgi:hypothetical protein